MAELARLAGTLRLGPLDALRLAGWKARQAALRRREARTGWASYARASTAFGAAWRRDWGAAGTTAWLQRPGAGRFFLAPDEAAAWCRATCTEADLALARASAAGAFDLIGSGPRALGDPPRWRTDLYTGVEWPLEESHRLRIVRGDGSDIRTVWELSRSYHFIALARAHWATGDARFVHAFTTHVDSWIEQNPFGRGPHWTSPMDAGIRAANWTLALLLFDGAPGVDADFTARLLANLHATARFVERHREWHPRYRGNHYVANGVGLAYLGALFADDPDGGRWLRLGTRIVSAELLRQVHPDGVSFEASLGYHRFATQLFAWGAELVRRNRPMAWTPRHDERLASMYDFIENYLPVSGLAPMLGDNDDGHLHVMDACMLAEPRLHRLGLPPRPAGVPLAEPGPRLYREGGFAILRHGRDHCIIRCGPVGLNGAGSHDHNDQLSFELVIDGERIVRDSGTYCYTRDLGERYRFRSTAAHNAIMLDGEEQNPIRVDMPWRVLEDRTRTKVVEWVVNEEELRFVGEHRGYERREGSSAMVVRRIRFLHATGEWMLDDKVIPAAHGSSSEPVEWLLHLAGSVETTHSSTGSLDLRIASVHMRSSFSAGLEQGVEDRPASDRYGNAGLRPVLVLSGSVSAPVRIVTRFGGSPRPDGDR